MTTAIKTTSPSDAARPRRKRLRISLGVMMILVVAVGGTLGWFAYRARVQRDAVAAILKARGVVLYNGERRPSAQGATPKLRGPKWLRDALGADVFDTVTSVAIRPDQLNDQVMAHVGRVDGLEFLNIGGPGLPPGLTSAGMSQIRHLKRLQNFVIQGPQDTNGFLPYIGPQRRLRVLRLQQSSPTDDDMLRIGSLTELETLEVRGEKVTDAGFSHLANLRKMKQLTLRNCAITDLGPVSAMIDLDRLLLGDGSHMAKGSNLKQKVSLEPLRGKKKLAVLSIGNLPTDDESLQVIATLPALLSFGASGRGITEKGLPHLTGAPSLFSVQLAETSIRDLRPFGPRAAKLVTLDLHGSPITDEGLSPLAGTRRMSRLILSDTEITDAGLAHLSAMNRLDSLWLENTNITDAGLAHLSGLTALTFLRLNGTEVTGAGMAHLAGSKKLAFVDLSSAPLTDDGMAGVAKIRSLKELILRATRISDGGLAQLKPLRGLETLILSGTLITDAGLAHLIAFSRLKSLSIRDTKVTDAGLVDLAKLRSLKTLDAIGTHITDAAITRLKAELPAIEVVRTRTAKRQ